MNLLVYDMEVHRVVYGLEVNLLVYDLEVAWVVYGKNQGLEGLEATVVAVAV